MEVDKILSEHSKQLAVIETEIKTIKKDVNDINSLVVSVSILAENMKSMVKEQEKQGKRLEALEKAPLQDYNYYKRLIIGCLLTGVIGTILGAVLALIIR